MPNLTPPEWLVAWAQTVNLWDILLGIAGIVGAIVGGRLFVSKAWPWLRNFAQAILSTAQLIDSVKGLPAFIERTDAAISQIHHELHPNSGTSLNDSTRRTEAAVADLQGQIGRVEEGVAGLYERVDDLAAVDDRLWTELEQTHPTEGGRYRDDDAGD